MDEAYARALRWVLGNRGKVIVVDPAVLRGLDGARRQGRHRVLPAHRREPVPGHLQGRRSARGWSGPRRSPSASRARPRGARPREGRRRRPGGHAPSSPRWACRSGRTALFTSNTGPHAGTVQVNLVPHTRRSVTDEEAAEKVRAALRDAIPGVQSYFFVGGIVKRILNFGAAGAHRRRDRGLRPRGRQRLRQAAAAAAARRSPTSDGRPCSPTSRSPARRTTPSSTSWWTARRPAMLGVSEQQVAQTVLDEPGRQHPVRAGAVHRPEDRQPVLHQRAARRRRAQRGGRPEDVLREGRRRHGAPARQRGRGEALGAARSR